MTISTVLALPLGPPSPWRSFFSWRAWWRQSRLGLPPRSPRVGTNKQSTCASNTEVVLEMLCRKFSLWSDDIAMSLITLRPVAGAASRNTKLRPRLSSWNPLSSLSSHFLTFDSRQSQGGRISGILPERPLQGVLLVTCPLEIQVIISSPSWCSCPGCEPLMYFMHSIYASCFSGRFEHIDVLKLLPPHMRPLTSICCFAS